jgi:hypothetical protein
MFIRLVTTRTDEDSHQPQGVFVAAYSLLRSDDLGSDEWKRVREVLDWFNEHLPHPPDNFTTGRAIFWFKASAKDSISQIWELAAVLREHGYHVEVHKCRRLANVCYSDRLQVAAYPSERDSRITIQ